jgi:hypothetical protein
VLHELTEIEAALAEELDACAYYLGLHEARHDAFFQIPSPLGEKASPSYLSHFHLFSCGNGADRTRSIIMPQIFTSVSDIFSICF